jgi:hypothetical protein
MNDHSVHDAAWRVLRACESGNSPQCRDVWMLQLSVRPCDAADLLLGYEDLARKLIAQSLI